MFIFSILFTLILYHYKLDFCENVNQPRFILVSMQLIKEEDKERDKIFISGMITHESDKGMCLAMIVRENLVIYS
jgi:uncharacterized protein YciU (UPF0263 family)